MLIMKLYSSDVTSLLHIKQLRISGWGGGSEGVCSGRKLNNSLSSRRETLKEIFGMLSSKILLIVKRKIPDAFFED